VELIIKGKKKERYSEHVYSHKAAQKKENKNSTKNSNIQPSLHTHPTSGTPNQQLNTAA